MDVKRAQYTLPTSIPELSRPRWQAGDDDGQKLLPHSADHAESHRTAIHRLAAAVRLAQTIQ